MKDYSELTRITVWSWIYNKWLWGFNTLLTVIENHVKFLLKYGKLSFPVNLAQKVCIQRKGDKCNGH